MKKLTLKNKNVYIVENHHETLRPFTLEREGCKLAPTLLTLDHHTDTLDAFTHYRETSGDMSFFEDDTEKALTKLRHDEHIDYAVKRNLISQALLITHEDFSIEHNPAIEIVHEAPSADTSKEAYYSVALESSFLNSQLERAAIKIEGEFILDIDLDYFKTRKSVSPDDDTTFCNLIRNASFITISMERDWVRLLNMDFERELNADFYLDKILRYIERSP